MNLPQYYAQALFELTEKNPENGKKYIHNLVGVLKHHDHMKLLPQILPAYASLELSKERYAKYRKVTPEQEQKRILLELYRKLISVT